MTYQLNHHHRFTQMLEDEGREYCLQMFAEGRASDLINGYWREYMQTGRVDTFEWDTEALEDMAHSSGVSDLKQVMHKAVYEKIVECADNNNAPTSYRDELLGPDSFWS